MNPTIYFISGLGADRRAFRKLNFPENFDCIYLDWIHPLPAETLEQYANRISEPIDKTKPFFLVGLSFGGMIATEIAKNLNPEHTFLISSVPVFYQLPWYYKVAGRLRLQKIVPLSLMKTGNSIGLKFLGAKTEDEKLLLKQLIEDSDPRFIKWALNSILTWRNTIRPDKLTHIHGTSDNILPIKKIIVDHLIKGGSHFMVYARADEVRKIITEIIIGKYS